MIASTGIVTMPVLRPEPQHLQLHLPLAMLLKRTKLSLRRDYEQPSGSGSGSRKNRSIYSDKLKALCRVRAHKWIPPRPECCCKCRGPGSTLFGPDLSYKQGRAGTWYFGVRTDPGVSTLPDENLTV